MVLCLSDLTHMCVKVYLPHSPHPALLLAPVAVYFPFMATQPVAIGIFVKSQMGD